MKKPIIFFVIFIIIASTLAFYFSYKDQKIKIIYFTNEKCIVNYLTDKLIEKTKNDFKERVEVQKINVSLYVNDPPDSEAVKQLREKYQVYGAPLIIINEEEFKKEYKYELFKAEICRSFAIKPMVCL